MKKLIEIMALPLSEIDTIIRSPFEMLADGGQRKRADNEEDSNDGGITDVEPERRPKESPTYWNTRVLTHRICGAHYKTPQYNMELLSLYIEKASRGFIRIRGKHFAVHGEKNLKFSTSMGDLSFDAHEEIDPNRFMARFGIQVNS